MQTPKRIPGASSLRIWLGLRAALCPRKSSVDGRFHGNGELPARPMDGRESRSTCLLDPLGAGIPGPLGMESRSIKKFRRFTNFVDLPENAGLVES